MKHKRAKKLWKPKVRKPKVGRIWAIEHRAYHQLHGDLSWEFYPRYNSTADQQHLYAFKDRTSAVLTMGLMIQSEPYYKGNLRIRRYDAKAA